ncbi:hypothetical protein GCM10023346_27280 [Arthrobacter gyeryongensis]|uniref:Uncharacterized protein n=1 Tax=Arthrobacter gyeryongensis TaxID=1650592 RepID=A0ABP9SGK1_9MICC
MTDCAIQSLGRSKLTFLAASEYVFHAEAVAPAVAVLLAEGLPVELPDGGAVPEADGVALPGAALLDPAVQTAPPLPSELQPAAATTMSAPRTVTENFNGIRFALMRTSLTAPSHRLPVPIGVSHVKPSRCTCCAASARIVGLGWTHGSRSA